MSEDEKVSYEFIGRSLATLLEKFNSLESRVQALGEQQAAMREEMRRGFLDNNERMTRFEAALFRFDDRARQTNETVTRIEGAMETAALAIREHIKA